MWVDMAKERMHWTAEAYSSNCPPWLSAFVFHLATVAFTRPEQARSRHFMLNIASTIDFLFPANHAHAAVNWFGLS
jgi:hypothetical protein